MKQTIALFVTIALLCTCLLCACTENSNNTISIPDVISTDDEISAPVEGSDVEDTSSFEESTTPNLSENTILDCYVYAGYGTDVIYVCSKLSNYRFNVSKEDLVDDYIINSYAVIYFEELLNENSEAVILILNGTDETVKIKYKDVTYNEHNNCTGFTIVDAVLGDMVFEQNAGSWYWEGEADGKYKPYVRITGNAMEISFKYIPKENYICEMLFPNEKTCEIAVIHDETAPLDRKYYAKGCKPELVFDNLKTYYRLPTENSVNITLYGNNKYGTGLLTGNFDILSRENGIASTNTFNGDVYYEEPFLENSEDANWQIGTITIDNLKYQVSYTEGYGDVNECYIIRMKDLNPEETADIIRIDYDPYYPNEFEASVYFTWEADGDIYTLTYPNGLTTVKKLCKRDDGVYYFEDYKTE